jgi:hypothetical protein
LEDPRYRTLIAGLRHRMLDEAVGTLRKLLDGGNSGVRLRAAPGILDAAVRMRDHVEPEARILRLEQDTANERAEGRPRIAIPDVDGRWARTPSSQGRDEASQQAERNGP